MTVLIILRFIMGIGLGAELVVGYASFAEFVPPERRGRMVALLSAVSNSAVFVAALISLWVIPTLGWRYMFAIVGVGALIVWFLRKWMPESPRWLEAVGRNDEAEAASRRHRAGSLPCGGTMPAFTAAPAPAKAEAGLGVLFSPGLCRAR